MMRPRRDFLVLPGVLPQHRGPPKPGRLLRPALLPYGLSGGTCLTLPLESSAVDTLALLTAASEPLLLRSLI